MSTLAANGMKSTSNALGLLKDARFLDTVTVDKSLIVSGGATFQGLTVNSAGKYIYVLSGAVAYTYLITAPFWLNTTGTCARFVMPASGVIKRFRAFIIPAVETTPKCLYLRDTNGSTRYDMILTVGAGERAFDSGALNLSCQAGQKWYLHLPIATGAGYGYAMLEVL